MTETDGTSQSFIPLELTAPPIQRIARKGLDERLTAEECATICECVVFHIDSQLQERRIPKALKKPGRR